MKKLVFTILVLAGIIGCSSDSKSSTAPATEVVIGTQTWKIKNLNVSTYRNGDPIAEVQDQVAWKALTSGAWCYFNNDPANAAKYGKLYNWYAVNDPRGLAPTGWHVPDNSEWNTLQNYLGGPTVAGGKMKEAGTEHWLDPNTDATNSSGFTALPGGDCVHTASIFFFGIGKIGYWWSSSENSATDAYAHSLNNASGNLGGGGFGPKNRGFSVRCIKD